jgi:hypothetical protein
MSFFPCRIVDNLSRAVFANPQIGQQIPCNYSSPFFSPAISADCDDPTEKFGRMARIGAPAALSLSFSTQPSTRNGANMIKTINARQTARQTVRSSKTVTDVQSMLHDIATVLRLTEMVKNEMLRDQAQVECRASVSSCTEIHDPIAVLA